VDTTPSAAMTASSSALLLVCSRPGKWKDIFLGSRGPNHTPQPAKPTPGASSGNTPLGPTAPEGASERQWPTPGHRDIAIPEPALKTLQKQVHR
jgi:hypothetical protein